MSKKTTRGTLIDREGRELGVVEIEEVRGSLRLGRFIPTGLPADLRELFSEYQALAQAQVLGLLDEIEEKLEARELKVVEEGDTIPVAVHDVQITVDNGISYRTRPA